MDPLQYDIMYRFFEIKKTLVSVANKQLNSVGTDREVEDQKK